MDPRLPRGECERGLVPSGKLYVAGDGTIVSPIGLGSGSIYTVDSNVSTATPVQLRADDSQFALAPATQRSEVQLPHPYPRVLALARSITAHDTDTYDKVQSLIDWIGAHTHYSENIPPLPAGADTVDEFLFGNRVGFCEQISTSLSVMLRSLGIPAREAVGYVPGSYDPITDLYQVHANDAHAWVQVWFPGYGWQDFDPTAAVPAEPPSPGATALRDVGSALGRIPRVPVAVIVVAVGLVVVLVRWRRARPATWAEQLCARARSVPAGARACRAGRPRRWPNTPDGSTTSTRARTPPGAGWPRRRRRAPTGGSTRRRRPSASWLWRPSEPGFGSGRVTKPGRPMEPRDRS